MNDELTTRRSQFLRLVLRHEREKAGVRLDRR
jgi:RNA:NAD 2'-phosphotransferase (TPT1/KptA family)